MTMRRPSVVGKTRPAFGCQPVFPALPAASAREPASSVDAAGSPSGSKPGRQPGYGHLLDAPVDGGSAGCPDRSPSPTGTFIVPDVTVNSNAPLGRVHCRQQRPVLTQ